MSKPGPESPINREAMHRLVLARRVEYQWLREQVAAEVGVTLRTDGMNVIRDVPPIGGRAPEPVPRW